MKIGDFYKDVSYTGGKPLRYLAFIGQRTVIMLIAFQNRVRGWGLSMFMKKCGKNFLVSKTSFVAGLNNLEVGDNISLGHCTELNASGGLVIEDNVLIGPGARILTHNHNYTDRTKPIMAQGHVKKPVRLCAESWICANAIVLPGVTVGKHSVVAAGSVVTKDVPPYTVVAGVPAKVIKHL